MTQSLTTYLTPGPQHTLSLLPGTNFSFKGNRISVQTNTEIDRWYVGSFSSASYFITVEYDSNRKETMQALVVGRAEAASLAIFGRVSIPQMITLTATVNDSWVSIIANPISGFAGVRVSFTATYAEAMTQPIAPTAVSVSDGGGGGSGGGSGVSVLTGSTLYNQILESPTVSLTGFTLTGSSGIGNHLIKSLATTSKTLSFPNVSGTVITTGDTGSITSSMIASGSIANDRLVNSSITLNGTSVPLGGSFSLSTSLSSLTFGSFLTGATAYNGSASATVSVDAASTNTANKVVVRDMSGSFAANIVTATQFYGTTLTTGSISTPGSIVGLWTLGVGSSLSATYADLAEKYQADTSYEPGTVVMIGGAAEVTAATDASRRVLGVISTNPAYVMNTDCDGEHVVVVAMTGRVPCRVTGKITAGDMLVAANNGFARAEEDPKLGSVIGKALEDHAGDFGVIEIVVGKI
jgi:hypothetical protein